MLAWGKQRISVTSVRGVSPALVIPRQLETDGLGGGPGRTKRALYVQRQGSFLDLRVHQAERSQLLPDGHVLGAVRGERRAVPVRPSVLEAHPGDAGHEVHLCRPGVAEGNAPETS